MKKKLNKSNPVSKGGYDFARHTQEEDLLNRWSFAKEIYRIAANGPRDWSVRVAVYGEWGSGKTSVLHFIESMASRDGHVVFRFNPWQFQNRDDLWKEFVKGLFKRIEDVIEKKTSGALTRSAKSVGSSIAGIVPACINLWNSNAGKATETGLSLLRKYLTFTESDLKNINSILGGKRLIIEVDDLDRTESQLVPEILFALKEIMDVPGMAFICAFDPVVVGHVLGNAHPGYGDGLRFLDKIIDYPRWLSTPTTKQFADLAVSDAKTICPYVPEDDLREAVELLPGNPRAIRQFIRLLDLLRPQIERHYPQEIHWPILLVANVMKVRFPQIAQQVLSDTQFWTDIYSGSIFEEKKEKERREIITKKIEDVVHSGDDSSKRAIATELEKCINGIADRLEAWHGISPDFLQYQFYIAEVPCAVTWREFDCFISSLGSRPTTEKATQWIEKHARDGGQHKNQVFSETFEAALVFRVKSLGKAADETSARLMNKQLVQAANMLALIEILIDLSRKPKTEFILENKHIAKLFDQISQYFHWRRTPAYRSARKQEKKLVEKLFYAQPKSIDPWFDIIGLNESHHLNEDRSDEWKTLIATLRSDLRNRCARWMIQQMSLQREFMRHVIQHETRGYSYQQLFLDLSGPVWTKQRKLLLKTLKSKDPEQILQNNAYRLLSWLVYRANQEESTSESAKAVLTQADFSALLWKACVSNPLNPRAVGSLRETYDFLSAAGNECKTPVWWDRIVKDLPSQKTS